MPRKKREKKGEAPWMQTFSDMTTLLLTMFIALFSMATISPGKFQQAVVSLQSVFEGQPVGVLVGGRSISEEPLITSNPGIRQELLKIIEDERYKGKITIEETDKGTIISMKDIAFFRTGSAELTAEAKELLYRIGTIILEHTSNAIEVYGFTDDRPILPSSLYPSNWHLSAARAASVVSFFTTELKNRRLVEKMAEINSGQFDIDYFYNSDRFFPIGLGDSEITKEINLLRSEIDSRKSFALDQFTKGEINSAQLQQIEKELENEYNTRLNELRQKYRRIDILILRQRVR
ncbi:flagellar motor protein MotB [Petrotoga miotherma DSM 10691]|uniref:Flagellar motor protein MotB n=2 Tax=Petrotoga TaxID=28236 RepID=A0A2K1P8I5_9BACT|nr:MULTISPECIES: flagellar motor protein MotB [Petrotoga]PNR99115.1 flagellar motor protein MotB [Petrotoga miotherma DSM 10691]POZ93610.1 flagellar motor protein MotB [Petrotoga halophila DSM 16923]